MEPARKGKKGRGRKGKKTTQLREGRRDSREDAVEDCPVCLTVFDEISRRPRSLPCGHTFCTPCVNVLKEQGRVTCPNCRVEHPVPEAGHFPVNYVFEEILRRMRGASLASPPPSAEKDPAESAHSLGTRPGLQGQKGLSKRVRSLLEEQEAKILAAIHSCQKVKAELNQYETTARDWGRQQQELEDKLQSLVDQCKDARVLARQEELSACDKRQQIDQGEQQLLTVLQAVRTAASAGEAYETIEDADHVMEEETQREEECRAMMPDVHTVTTIKKVTEVAQAALAAAATVQAAQQTAGVGGGAAGDASLPAAAASSIRDRVDALMSPPLKTKDIPSMMQHVKNLMQRGLVFAVHTMEGQQRLAKISLENKRMCLYSLRNQPLPRGAATVQVDDVVPAAPPCLVFLDIRCSNSDGYILCSGRVFIRLRPDTPMGRQFLLLCTGQRGPSYNGTWMWEVWRKGQSGESLCGGKFNPNNGGEGPALLPDLDKGEYGNSCNEGDVWGRLWNDPALGALFNITTKSWPYCVPGIPCVFGKVVGGLEVVVRAVQNISRMTNVIVADCGVVL